MAVAWDGTRVNDADAVGSVWNDYGGGACTLEQDFYYQGNASISEQVKTSENGVYYYDSGTSNDLTTPKVIIFKVLVSTNQLLNVEGSTGAILECGSGEQSAYYRYYAFGSDTYDPPRGGWLLLPVDPNVTAWRDETIGSPSLSAVDYYAIAATMTGSVKSQNVAMDAIDIVNAGKGLTWTGSSGTFQEFVDYDEGTSSLRYGIVYTLTGISYCNGRLTIGSSTATTFTDEGAVIVFPSGRYGAGHVGIAADLQNASTAVDVTDCTFRGDGQSDLKRFFDSISQVDATNDELDITAHGYTTGDAVLYSKQGGSDAIGLTDATEYWVENVTANSISLHTSRQNAITSATPVNLSAGSSGENHSIRRQPDTRPDLAVTGTSGTFDATGCSFDRFRQIGMTSGATLTGCKILGSKTINLNQGQLDTCEISTQTSVEGEALVVTSDISDIADCEFTAGVNGGHAIEINSTSGGSGFSGNVFTDYGPNPATFSTDNTGIDASSEVITTDAAHLMTDGHPVYYNKEGGSAAVGLTDGALYYVNAITSTTLSLHRSRWDAELDQNRINLSTSGAETHSLYSGNAAVYNSTSSGTVTIAVTNAAKPTYRNAVGATTTITLSVPVKITVKDNDLNAIQGARCYVQLAAGPFDDSNHILREETNASGVAEDTHDATGVSVTVRVRKKGYLPVMQTQTISASGLDITIQLANDPFVE